MVKVLTRDETADEIAETVRLLLLAADGYARWVQECSHRMPPEDFVELRARFGDRLLFARAKAEMLKAE